MLGSRSLGVCHTRLGVGIKGCKGSKFRVWSRRVKGVRIVESVSMDLAYIPCPKSSTGFDLESHKLELGNNEPPTLNPEPTLNLIPKQFKV